MSLQVFLKAVLNGNCIPQLHVGNIMSNRGSAMEGESTMQYQRRLSAARDQHPPFMIDAGGILIVTQQVQYTVNNAIRNYMLTVMLTKEKEGGYSVYCVEIRGPRAQGESETEALTNVAEVVTLMRETEVIPDTFLMWYRISQ